MLIAQARTPDELEDMVARRAAGLPLEQVLGWAEFCGLRISVDPGIFVPRRRTEFLVRQAAALARPADIIVDPCCGAGAIGAALAAAVDRADVHAVDIDPAAVRCARRNVPGQVYQGDLYEPLPGRFRGRVGILAANVPYVPAAEIRFLPPEARAHEPLVALDGGPDGLDVLRRVAAGAPAWLAAGGHLLIETSERQAAQAAAAFADSGLNSRVVSSADRSATVVIGRLAASPAQRVDKQVDGIRRYGRRRVERDRDIPGVDGVLAEAHPGQPDGISVHPEHAPARASATSGDYPPHPLA